MKSERIYSTPPNKKWTNDQLFIEAQKYLTRKDFKLNSKHAYYCAQKRKKLKEICQHMTQLGNRYKRLIYSFEFSNKHVYVGLTYQPEIRKTRHLNDSKSQVYKHIQATNLLPEFKILSEYLDSIDASLKEKEFIENYKNKGFIVLNKTTAGELGGNQYKWSETSIRFEAIKYLSVREFYSKSPKAYDAARRRGIITLIKEEYYNGK